MNRNKMIVLLGYPFLGKDAVIKKIICFSSFWRNFRYKNLIYCELKSKKIIILGRHVNDDAPAFGGRFTVSARLDALEFIKAHSMRNCGYLYVLDGDKFGDANIFATIKQHVCVSFTKVDSNAEEELCDILKSLTGDLLKKETKIKYKGL